MLNALTPVFALILLGCVLRYLVFPGVDFWRGAERLTYYLLFPALLFLKLSTISLSGDIQVLQMVLLLVGLLLIITVVLVLCGYMFDIRGMEFTSFYQGGIRFNTYVGLAVVNGLLGDPGLVMAAVVVGIMIPVINLLCISVFAYVGEGVSKSRSSIIRNIVTNPLILACIFGMIWNESGLVLPRLIVSVLELLSATALPLGLLAVGAGVHVARIGRASKQIIVSSVIKLMFAPVLAYTLCLVMGQSDSVTMVVVIVTSLPTASSAYILSKELGGDAETMAAIITAQTLFAMFSMPLLISCLG